MTFKIEPDPEQHERVDEGIQLLYQAIVYSVLGIILQIVAIIYLATGRPSTGIALFVLALAPGFYARHKYEKYKRLRNE